MAIDAEDSLSADTRGLAQLVLTWALAAPPLLFWWVGIVDQFDSSIAPALLDMGARALAWPLFLIGVFHWVFTASTVVSSVILTFRSAPDRRKVNGWMAAFVAVLASLYVRGHNQF